MARSWVLCTSLALGVAGCDGNLSASEPQVAAAGSDTTAAPSDPMGGITGDPAGPYASTGGSPEAPSPVDAVPGGVTTGPVASPSSGASGAGPVVEPSCDQPTAPRAPLRRITRFEFNNSVRDLLSVTSNPADALPGEEAGSGFGNDADALGVSRLLIDGYRTVAEQVAEEVTVTEDAVTAVTGCDPALDEAQCEQSFLTSYLTRAFRRPPAAEELESYRATFDQGRTLGADFASGVRAVVERSLQSPQFLYRIEVGVPTDVEQGLARPTGYEMATRLSYLLWSSTPDAALLEAAAQGRLETPQGVATEAQRLLEDDRAKDSLRYFHGQLLGTAGLDFLERDSEIYPTFQPGMGALFRQETERFLDYVIWQGEGDLATVFTAPYTFVNEPLATFYGLSGVSGDAFVQVPVDTSQRAGLLTQASILTLTSPGSRSDPVVRGKWLFTKMLCGKVPDPPNNIPLPPERLPGEPVGDWLARHRDDPACAGCHQLMDPLGLAFEHYDGVGLWRDTDNGAAIDASGNIPTGDVAGPFEGAIEFGQRMAQSQDVRDCYVGRYLTYAYGRGLDGNDVCSRRDAENAFRQAGGNVKELILAVAQTDGFLLRPAVASEQ